MELGMTGRKEKRKKEGKGGRTNKTKKGDKCGHANYFAAVRCIFLFDIFILFMDPICFH